MFPDFNRLKVFYFIYSNRSVVLAAKQLHVTQSAVSQSLSKLEEELNQSLFTRVHKRLVPTSEAEILYNVVQPFIKNLQDQLRLMQQSHSMPSGKLKIGAPVEFGEKYLVPACAVFRKEYPDVQFQLELGHPDKLLPGINQGMLDFSFIDIFIEKGEYARETALLDIQPIFSEKLILACSGEYYASKINGDHSFKNLSKQNFISYQKHSPAIRNWFRHHLGKTAVTIQPILSVESVKGVISGIKQSLGLGIVPSYLIGQELEAGEIMSIDLSPIELINRISLIRLLDKVPNLTEKTFIDHFKAFIKRVQN